MSKNIGMHPYRPISALLTAVGIKINTYIYIFIDQSEF